MYSKGHLRQACRAGYHGFQTHGDNATANRSGYGAPGVAWAFYTGQQAARGGYALKQAYATLKLGRHA